MESIEDVFVDDTPVELPDMHTEKIQPEGEAWTKPDFAEQTGALGYEEGVFNAPPEMQKRFEFWKDIYTKYTSEQGLIHDAKYLHLIYRELDFRPIANDANLNEVQKFLAKKRLVQNVKKEVVQLLNKLQKYDSQKVKNPEKISEELSPEEIELWKKFESINGTRKFIEASRAGRLRFQLGQRDRIELGVFYSGRYLKKMEQIFRDEGLPVELTRLPFVESSFNIYARSKVGASGIWQFVPRTGRAYMKINNFIDERNDPLIATKASAKLLKQNFNLLKSWPLAVTGYNHGAFGVRGLTKKLKTENLNEIIERASSRRFGFAGENFYSSFMAILHVESNADKYFGSIKRSSELKFEKIPLPTSVLWDTVLTWFEGDVDKAKMYNPHINLRKGRSAIRIPTGVSIHLPPEKAPEIVIWLEEQKKKPQSSVVVANNDSPSEKGGEYYVRKGDTLSHIARHLRVTIKDLMEANDLSSANKIKPGLKLVVPD